MMLTMRFSVVCFLTALLLGLLTYGILDIWLFPTQLLMYQDLSPDPGDYLGNLSKVISGMQYLAADERETLLQELRLKLGAQPCTNANHSHKYDESVVGHAISPTILPPRTWVRYNKKWEGMNLPVLTVEPLGRLGNVMGEYATLYALHKIYKVSSVVIPICKQKLSCFTNLTLPNIDTYERNDWTSVKNIGTKLYNYAPIELAAAGLLGPKLFVMREYAFEIQLFHELRDEVVQQFSFSPEIQREANARINKILESLNISVPSLRNNSKNITYHQNLSNGTSETHVIEDSLPKKDTTGVTIIGFHIRRTDYVKHAKTQFGAKLPEDGYFNLALEYYRKKHKYPIFIVATDDYNYSKSKLSHNKDVFFASGSSPCVDMAILSMAEDSIITLGSFGFWTGYLAGGEIVYPDVKFYKEYRFSRDMFESIGLDFMTPLPVT